MNRSAIEPLSEEQCEQMTDVMNRIYGAVGGFPKSIALSALAQTLMGNLGDEGEVSDEAFKGRVVAVLGLMNLIQCGLANPEVDQVVLAEAVDDLTSIVALGARGAMIPALVAVLVAAVANGRRDSVAESECMASIMAALKILEGAVGSPG